MNDSIKIQYFGTLRLKFHIKEEDVHICETCTLKDLINIIDKKYGDFLSNSRNYLYFYYPNSGEESKQLRFPKDKDINIKNNSTIKIFNAITLG